MTDSTTAPEMPVYMRRSTFTPDPELARIREEEGVRKVSTSFGLDVWMVTRFADVREVLGDPPSSATPARQVTGRRARRGSPTTSCGAYGRATC
ncbi:hypothetical protein WBK31_17380 [Nonomuraea sp. N2-4H]|uniref:hypothetical protein n=1 Tax=Nonomuraea sp. N2-4H TaxID=3128898 RepID=UPI00325386DA